MPNDAFDAAVFIGRFQPFHNGHAALLRAALSNAGTALIVLGSAFRPRDARNPFVWRERAAMITACLDADSLRRTRFIPVRDYYDDLRWAAAVEEEVKAECANVGLDAPRLALVGFFKDASSDYLNLFPGWTRIELPRQGDVDASRVRQLYFESDPSWRDLVPPSVARCLEDWKNQPAFADIQEERRALSADRLRWGEGPFVTVDAVVTTARQVLLVRRGNPPGKGLWAIPGGFLEGQERLLQGAIRELMEETRLEITAADLEAALRETAVFDHPDRSPRGRVITHAQWFDLPDVRPPAVFGADDAAEARWFPIDGLSGMESALFEDHFHILRHFLKFPLLPRERLSAGETRLFPC